MTLQDKLRGALMHSRKHMSEELWGQIHGFLSPASLTIMGVFTTAWGVSQFFGVGEVADAVLLVTGYAMVGAQAVPIGMEMYKFAIGVNSASTDAELEEPGEHFAAALVMGGVAVISAIMFLKRPPSAKMFKPNPVVNIGYPTGDTGLFYRPKVEQRMMKPNVGGITTAWGDIWINMMHSPEVQEATLFHEKVHSFLTPKLSFLRDVRVMLSQGGYAYSYLLTYLEEALAEGWALFKTKKNVIDAVSFPMKQPYYIMVTQLATETKGWLLGPVNVGSIPYRVYASTTRPTTISKPTNVDKGRRP